jgi:hypothetical protein
MDIIAKITGIKYKIYVKEKLKKFSLLNFDINKLPSSFILEDENISFAMSKWVSPKRTRSYPYERIYNTLSGTKKITIIPIVKDEGFKGDRDFIAWDTISMMSLLDVYVIFAYYEKAEKHTSRKDKITNQSFNNTYILAKINEIKNYHSSALHWNINELKINLYKLMDKVKHSYSQIESDLKIKLHSSKGLDDFQKKIETDLDNFMDSSRKKSMDAQSREIRTTQPKEFLQTLTKAKITITNYLGGKYFLTIDEIEIKNNLVYLIESKHSKSSILPSLSDIKDGLLKLILLSNLKAVTVDGKKIKSKPILNLTSFKLKGSIQSDSIEIDKFFKLNLFNERNKELIKNIFREAKENHFLVRIKGAK